MLRASPSLCLSTPQTLGDVYCTGAPLANERLAFISWNEKEMLGYANEVTPPFGYTWYMSIAPDAHAQMSVTSRRRLTVDLPGPSDLPLPWPPMALSLSPHVQSPRIHTHTHTHF